MFPKEPKAGEIIDNKYRILKLLGSGGMGSVYLIEHVQLGKIYAMKVLSAQLAVNPVIRGRFLYEAKLAAQFDHPNIIRVHDYNSVTYIYYVMDYIDGIDLQRIIAKGPMPLQQAFHYLRQIAEAVDYLHHFSKHVVIHRDIKPANIMLDKNGRTAIIVDFGIAKKIASQDEGADFTKTNEFVGTPEYMSPEQLKREQLTPSTDIYAVGLLAYEMLTGKKAFTYLNPAQIIHDISQLYPPPPSRYIQGAPDVDRVFRIVLDKNPQRRFRSCAEFYHELARSLKVKTDAVTPRHMPPPRPRTQQNWLPYILAGAGALILLVVLIIMLVTMQPGGSGYLQITGRVPYYLSIDSRPPERIVPPRTITLPAGDHVLIFENENLPNPIRGTVTIVKGQTVPYDLDIFSR